MKFLHLVVLAVFAHSVAGSGFLKDDPVVGLCDSTVKSFSGYYSDETATKNYFFWFFESRSTPSTDPLVVWFTGGPGCSSILALLSENGPCTVSEDGKSTINNPYSWNSNANIMWIDQPANVGYSYGADGTKNETGVSDDMYNFLQQFFKAHPEYLVNEFFVFGESYGGHYAPAIASRVYQGNQNKEGILINLKGVGVGNGLTDPVIQYQYYPQMANNNTYGIKAVSDDVYSSMVSHLPTCLQWAQSCQTNDGACGLAETICNMYETSPYYSTGLNPYDIRKPCGSNPLCYDFSNIETFLNLDSTRNALHVSSQVGQWQSCNNDVNAAFVSDWMRNYQLLLTPMLEDGIRVLIYAGDVDFICNWMGNKAWTKQLPWTGQSSFNAEVDHPWSITDSHVTSAASTQGGFARTATASAGEGGLTFLQVFNAGHLVPHDQPAAALSLLNTFTANKPFY